LEQGAEAESAIESVDDVTPRSAKQPSLELEDSCEEYIVDQEAAADDDNDSDDDIMINVGQDANHMNKQYNSSKPMRRNSGKRYSQDLQVKINVEKARANPKRNSLRVQISGVKNVNSRSAPIFSIVDDNAETKDNSMSREDSGRNSGSLSPRVPTNPIPMTAFDLIGIVSTQMLNNMFVRSLKEESPVRSYTQFVTAATPAKILWALEQTVDQMKGCTYCLESDRYEFLVTKKFHKCGSIVTINVKIFHSPTGEYVVECRRQSGNVFRYHDFFDEFQETYKQVLEQMTTDSPNEEQFDTNKNTQLRESSSPLLKPYSSHLIASTSKRKHKK